MDLVSCVKNGVSDGQLQLSQTFSRLWSEHVMWTRSLIASVAFDLPDQIEVTKRLLRNPADFADVLRRYYSDNTANRFQKLLTDLLFIAGQLVNAAKAGDIQRAQELRARWNINSDETAEFLRSINPFWREAEWRIFLYDLLKKTEKEAAGILTGKYEASIEKYQLIQASALEMADCMTRGIVSQFRLKGGTQFPL